MTKFTKTLLIWILVLGACSTGISPTKKPLRLPLHRKWTVVINGHTVNSPTNSINLNDYESFGNFIAQVMQVVNSLPKDMLTGPNPGFVEFHFEKDASDAIRVHIPVYQYNETAKDKTGEKLFRLFYTEP